MTRLLTLFLLLSACSSPTTPAENPFWIRLGEERVVEGLRIRFVQLNDSRCAPNVVCVWEGDGVVTLEVDGERVVVHTHGGEGMPRTATVRGYRITLEELTRDSSARISVVRVSP